MITELTGEVIQMNVVNGPFSLERVSAVYDIMSVDGTEMVLRER